MATEANTRAEFDAALANADQVILLVMGDGAAFDTIAQNAEGAILFDQTQHVVWLRDLTVLTDKERATFEPGDPKFVACALSVPPRLVCARVARQSALTLNFMQAVVAAENREQPARSIE